MNSSGRCEVGLCRPINEDSIFIFNDRYGCLPNLYIVADGMGGHNAGEIASALAIKFFCEYIHENEQSYIKEDFEFVDMIKAGIFLANQKIYDYSKTKEELEGMGTTFVVATIVNNKMHVENVGDSRLYLIRNNEIIQITVDHTYIMELVKNGTLTEAEAANHPKKNAITRAVGAEQEVLVDNFEIELFENDVIMLCSDGLTNMVKEDKMLEIILGPTTLEEKVETLVKEANENGGNDNISVIIIENK